MRIESEIKLDYKDVLFRPKRSTLNSRSEVQLEVRKMFNNSDIPFVGIPIIASNMDTTGTFTVAKCLFEHGMITAIDKNISLEEWNAFNKESPHVIPYIIPTIGTSNADFEKLSEIFRILSNRPFGICIDIANGYSEHLIRFVKKVRSEYIDIPIIAGNVVTREMTEELILSGANIVKVGIGPGCFASNTRVLMSNGTYKDISKIKVGERVINCDGNPVTVIGSQSKGIRKVVDICTNNWYKTTTLTPDHKYWIGDCSRVGYNIKGKRITNIMEQQYDLKWESISNINKERMFLLTPRNIKWELEDTFKIDLSTYCGDEKIKDNCIYTNDNERLSRFLISCYDIGYIFGLFLGDGYANLHIDDNYESGVCYWFLGGYKKDVANKLKYCIKNTLNVNCKTKMMRNMTIVTLNNKYLTKILYEFGKKVDKHLPNQYYINDTNYIQGLYDGLVDSSSYKKGFDKEYFCNNSNQLIELFNWCCMVLGYTYSNSHSITQSYKASNSSKQRFSKDYMYSYLTEYIDSEYEAEVFDIEVDCPTHSFIANGSIVHNSVCTTRKQTGVGYPQLSAVMECADAAHGLGGHIIADGGCCVPGDVAKAFGAGADFVMLGGMFAGHDECTGDVIVENGKKYKIFYGMSSDTAMNKYKGYVAEYRASEGKTVKVPYRGPLKNTILEILGGVRSTCTYVGAHRLKDLPKCTTFIRVTQQLNDVYK